MLLARTKTQSSSSIILRGANDFMVDEMERSIHDSLCVVKRVLESQKVVPGGGAVEIALSIYLENLAESMVSGVDVGCCRLDVYLHSCSWLALVVALVEPSTSFTCSGFPVSNQSPCLMAGNDGMCTKWNGRDDALRFRKCRLSKYDTSNATHVMLLLFLGVCRVPESSWLSAALLMRSSSFPSACRSMLPKMRLN